MTLLEDTTFKQMTLGLVLVEYTKILGFRVKLLCPLKTEEKKYIGTHARCVFIVFLPGHVSNKGKRVS